MIIQTHNDNLSRCKRENDKYNEQQRHESPTLTKEAKRLAQSQPEHCVFMKFCAFKFVECSIDHVKTMFIFYTVNLVN